MRALIIEDEIKTGTYLCNGLRENGWDSDVALDGEEGLRLALAREYDLVILDVMLPLRDGWSVITEMRNESRLTPVLFLTARDAVGERVKGLDLGADDYLVTALKSRSASLTQDAGSVTSTWLRSLTDFIGWMQRVPAIQMEPGWGWLL
jgi:DNA-binding response OmpR family regulator